MCQELQAKYVIVVCSTYPIFVGQLGSLPSLQYEGWKIEIKILYMWFFHISNTWFFTRLVKNIIFLAISLNNIGPSLTQDWALGVIYIYQVI